jgi:hypothetical protein
MPDKQKPGFLRGRHFTEYVSEARSLETAGLLREAEVLLSALVEATEADSAATRGGVAPWYYERLAILYHKQRRYEEEVRIVERFASRRHVPGVGPAKLAERLEQTRRLYLGPDTRPPANLDRFTEEVLLAEPVISREVDLVAALRAARGFDGRPVLKPDAPLRVRDGAVKA